jgi:small acid-soluble spore protein H (minor)
MDAQRAQEITNSTIMANVIYNGTPIYIEHVDQQKGITTIHRGRQSLMPFAIP